MVKIKSWLKLIKTARVFCGGCICNGCDVAAANQTSICTIWTLPTYHSRKAQTLGLPEVKDTANIELLCLTDWFRNESGFLEVYFLLSFF